MRHAKGLNRLALGAGLALTVLAVGSCSSTAQHRSTGQVIDDASIQAQLKSHLIDDPRVDANEVNLEVKRGIVTLLGWVTSDAERKAVEDIAWSVNGVKDVNNELRLKSEIRNDSGESGG